MKKTYIALIIILLVILLGGGYFLTKVYQKTKTDSKQLSPKEIGELNYKTFTPESEPITFLYPEEWVQISSEQIEKTIPEEVKKKTRILFYASSPQNIIISGTKSKYPAGPINLEQIIKDKIDQSKKVDPNLKESYEVEGNKVNTRITYNLQGKSWTTEFRGLLVEKPEENILYILQVTIPVELENSNKEIIEKILSSLEI